MEREKIGMVAAALSMISFHTMFLYHHYNQLSWDHMGNSKINQNFFPKKYLHVQLNIVSPCVVVCLKLIKTETFCKLLNFLYLSRILKMMVQMDLACYKGGIFLYDIRAHTYD